MVTLSATPRLKMAGLVFGVMLCTAAGALGDDKAFFPNLDTNDDGGISVDEYSAYARFEGAFDDWDLNNDGFVGREEWDLQYDYDYSGWDLNGDGVLDKAEFYSGSFRHYDEAEDGHLSRDEWDVAADGAVFRK